MLWKLVEKLVSMNWKFLQKELRVIFHNNEDVCKYMCGSTVTLNAPIHFCPFTWSILKTFNKHMKTRWTV